MVVVKIGNHTHSSRMDDKPNSIYVHYSLDYNCVTPHASANTFDSTVNSKLIKMTENKISENIRFKLIRNMQTITDGQFVKFDFNLTTENVNENSLKMHVKAANDGNIIQ